MDQKTKLTVGAGIAGLVILILLLRANSNTVIQEGGTKNPNYYDYNVPVIPYVPTPIVSYKPPTAPTQTPDKPSPCLCSSGCGDDGEYAGALRSILDAFWESTAKLTDAYQGAILSTLPPYFQQYINNDKGYIESQRALKAIGTAFGVGENAPVDLTAGHYGFRGIGGSE
jgi:hypothetical protein